jgi:hypothetical protein
VSLRAIGSVIESMPGSVLENVLGGVLGSVLELTWERMSSRVGVYNRVKSGVCFRAYLGACNEMHLADWFQAS